MNPRCGYTPNLHFDRLTIGVHVSLSRQSVLRGRPYGGEIIQPFWTEFLGATTMNERRDFLKLRKYATSAVHDWLFLEAGEGSPNEVSRSEPMEVVRGRDHLEDAAAALQEWFTERLTVDPGFPSPFLDLGANLIHLT